jgi:hypothetical protein
MWLMSTTGWLILAGVVVIAIVGIAIALTNTAEPERAEPVAKTRQLTLEPLPATSRSSADVECRPVPSAQRAAFRVPDAAVACDIAGDVAIDTMQSLGTFYSEDIPESLFLPLPANAQAVTIDSVSGEFHNAYLLFKTDLWTHGFRLDGTLADVEVMEQQVEHAVGMLERPSSCHPGFAFNSTSSSSFEFGVDDPGALQRVQGSHLRGTLRLALHHLDFYFQLHGQQQCLRIVGTSCDGHLGDKQLLVGDTFQWLDMETNQLCQTRPKRPATIWPETSAPGFQDALMEAFQRRRFGVPVELEAGPDGVDFSQLQDPEAKMSLRWMPPDRLWSSGSLENSSPKAWLRHTELSSFGIRAKLDFQ